jgi:drug/metabolite transporter (DMT)-like permease
MLTRLEPDARAAGPPDRRRAAASRNRPSRFGAIAYFSILGTAVAYLLYYRVVAAAGSGNALIVTLLIPPVAIVLGALVLDERLGPDALGGLRAAGRSGLS